MQEIEAAIQKSEWMDIALYEHAESLFETRYTDLLRRRQELKRAGLPSGKGVNLPECPELPTYALLSPARIRAKEQAGLEEGGTKVEESLGEKGEAKMPGSNSL